MVTKKLGGSPLEGKKFKLQLRLFEILFHNVY